jgi:hypothetical protein
MLGPHVAGFLRQARLDSELNGRVNAADTYDGIARISEGAGVPATSDQLRAAFTARDAAVLVRQMMRRGIIDSVPLPPVLPFDLELWNRVETLDLGPVADQLIQQGWTEERTAAVERSYRRFFYLKATLPEGMASPTAEVDQFWHQHIINTRRYGPDCERVIGRFAHHTFLSFEDASEAKELWAVWLSTWVSYETLFQEPYEETIGAALLQRWPSI